MSIRLHVRSESALDRGVTPREEVTAAQDRRFGYCRCAALNESNATVPGVQTSTYLAVSLAGTDEALGLVEAFEAGGGFAHHSHKPTADPTSDASEASSAVDAEQVVM
jgi:hypothetical protein